MAQRRELFSFLGESQKGVPKEGDPLKEVSSEKEFARQKGGTIMFRCIEGHRAVVSLGVYGIVGGKISRK